MPLDQLSPRAERRFQIWMLISAWMYALTGVFIIFGGQWIIQTINAISERVFPSLPLYPLPQWGTEGKFWLVLSVSMLAMIAYICRAAYLDPRRNWRLVPIVLLSKFCSSALYLAFFISDAQLAYFIAFAVDTPLFVITLAIWLPAASGDSLIGRVDEEILSAIGEAAFPRGGAFEPGYADFRNECLADTGKMFAEYYPHMLLGVKLMLRAFDLSPIWMFFRPSRFRRLPVEQRQELMCRLEQHRFFGFRMMMMAVKLFVAMPFFNQRQNSQTVGWTTPENDV